MKSWVHLAVLLVSGLFATIGLHPAAAAPDKIAITDLEIGGDGAPELRTQLAKSIARGITDANATPVPLNLVLDILKATPRLIGCISTTCLARIGEKLGVYGFIRAKVGAEGADYSIELEFFDRSQLLHRVGVACSPCTIGELNTRIRKATAKLISAVSDASISVIIQTKPGDSKLAIDGEAVGSAPYKGMLTLGPHFIVATSPSGNSARLRVEVTTQTAATPIVINIGNATQTGIDAPNQRWKTWKWVSAGAAVLSLSGAFYLFSIDGEGTCNARSAECPMVKETTLATVGLTVIGLSLAATSAWMFWQDGQTGTSVSAQATINANQASVSLALCF